MNAPERGDLIWIDFDPQSGREQAGRRPALVLTPRSYNRVVGLIIACPVTRHAKGYPFETSLPVNLPVSGVVLADHVRSLDWRAREAKFICKPPPEIVDEVLAKIRTLFSEE